MEIIKQGDMPKTKGKCKYCGCEFLYTRNDVRNRDSRCAYVICPTCGDDNIFLMQKDRKKLKLDKE